MSKNQTPKSFWDRVKKVKSGCMEWQGCVDDYNYGTVSWNGQMYKAHRIAAWLSGILKNKTVQTINKNRVLVLHRCDNTICCNPKHLFIGSDLDNVQDMIRKGRSTGLKGELNGSAKLSNKKAAEIRKAYSKGRVTQIQLSNKYNVSQSTISRLILKETFQ